jgi:uncharacterized protein
MLTGKQVRVRVSKGQLIPLYIDPAANSFQVLAGQLVQVFRQAVGLSRTEIDEQLETLVGEGPGSLVNQGLAKLLEDRSDFEVSAELPPEELRDQVFTAASSARQAKEFDRDAVLVSCAAEHGLSIEQLVRGLFADLKDEQRMLSFDDITPDALLHRYNLALAQALLLRSTQLEVRVWGETPARYRQLFRAIKFHKLLGTFHPDGTKGYRIVLDGPLSLFSSTQKYGLQLANLLPTLLHCKAFDLHATVKWGADRKQLGFHLSPTDGLRSHTPDFGVYTPRELQHFEDNWTIDSDPHPQTLDGTTWVPDFTLTHMGTGKVVYLEIIGFWRKVDLNLQLKRLRSGLPGQFLLAVSEAYRADEVEDVDFGDGVYRYKRLPVATEVVRLAELL